jgi:hypothetical protein
MNAVCKVCSHPDRRAIEAGLVAGTNYAKLSQTFSVSAAGLSRHRKRHMEGAICPEHDQNLIPGVDIIIEELRALQRRGRRSKNHAAGAELILKTSRELRSWFALRAQLVRRQPAIPTEASEPELDQDQLAEMAQALVAKQKGKLN